MDSILNTIRKLCQISDGDTSFDTELIIFINSALAILTEIGVGLSDGFEIAGDTETWKNFYGEDVNKTLIQNYVRLKVVLDFDPPSSSFVLESLKKELSEIEWRLYNKYDGG